MLLQLLITTAALLATNAGIVSTLCPDGCTCNTVRASCASRGLKTPPPGYWPDITWLELSDNDIASLELYSLLGFPNLDTLIADRNPITTLDLNVLTVVKNLSSFFCWNSKIEKVIPLSPGVELPNLLILSLSGNHLTTAPDITGLTNDQLELVLHNNPITLSGDQPFLTSENLANLYISTINVSEMTPQTFKNLPNLQALSMTRNNLVNVTNRFTSLPKLSKLILSGNNIKVIEKGFLSEAQNVSNVDLGNNKLEEIDITGLKGMTGGGYIDISFNPLACDCKYETLYWWAKYKGVTVLAQCGDNTCDFMEEERPSNIIVET